MQSSHGMGVGMKYPGSTGGEIFNYYTDDTNKNTAEGDYSTTVGYNNKSVGDYYLTSGSGNTITRTGTDPITGGLVAGSNNQIIAYKGASICLGDNNKTYGNNQVCIGYDNSALNAISEKSVCVGRGLQVDNNQLKTKVVLGTYNSSYIASSQDSAKLKTIIGGGYTNSSSGRNNVLEVYSQMVNGTQSLALFPQHVALSNYTTVNQAHVNAIDPPADPDAITTNEQTLATLGSLDAFKALLNSMHLQRREVLVTGQITYFTKGTAYNLETTFDITIPSWANRLRMGVQISALGSTQGYVEFGLASGNYTYTALNTGTNNFFVIAFSYDSTTKSITVTQTMILKTSDGSFSPSANDLGVISITAYGTAIF